MDDKQPDLFAGAIVSEPDRHGYVTITFPDGKGGYYVPLEFLQDLMPEKAKAVAAAAGP